MRDGSKKKNTDDFACALFGNEGGEERKKERKKERQVSIFIFSPCIYTFVGHRDWYGPGVVGLGCRSSFAVTAMPTVVDSHIPSCLQQLNIDFSVFRIVFIHRQRSSYLHCC